MTRIILRTGLRWLLDNYLLVLFVSLGSCACSTSRPPDEAAARVAFYSARTNGPATYPAYARLGLALLDQYRETVEERCYTEALANLQRSLSYQRNFEALLGMGLALSERHHFTEALPYVRESLDAMHSHVEAEAAYFDIHLALGDIAMAEEVSNRMLKQAPGFAAYTRAAALAEYRGDWQTAINYLEKALAQAELSPSSRAWCEVRIGSLFMFLGNASQARKRYDRALGIAPNYFFAKEHLAEWNAAQGRWRDAERLYRSLLAQRPEANFRAAFGEALEKLGRSTEARHETAAAIRELRTKVAAGKIDQLRELAILLLSEGESAQEALELAQRDHAMRHDVMALDTLGWALSVAGRHDEALEVSQPLLDSASNNPTVLLHAALIRLRAGRGKEVEPLLRRAQTFELAFTTPERKALVQAEKLSGINR